MYDDIEEESIHLALYAVQVVLMLKIPAEILLIALYIENRVTAIVVAVLASFLTVTLLQGISYIM